MSMKPIGEALKKMVTPSQVQDLKPIESSTALTASQKNTALAIVDWKNEDKLALGVCLGEELITLRAYGKTGDDIPAINEAFIKKFNHYPPEKVIGAIREWGLKGTGDFPTPPDIEAILNPQPKFDYAIYSRLLSRMKNGEYLSDTEHKYIKRYEQNAMKGIA